jgi:TRAP transporter TAXI family solute receptor
MQRPWTKIGFGALVLAFAALLAGGAAAEDAKVKLPRQIAWTAYDVGSGGYNSSVAIGKALKDAYGVDLRVLPGKNDVSRTIPLREGKVPFSATGIGASYFAQDGLYEFGAPDWGPQPVRLVIYDQADQGSAIGTAKDADIKTLKDLKGKRVAWVVGAPALNENIAAFLYAAGLSWDDVKKVEFGGFGASWDGIINGQVDAAWATTTSGKAYQLEASPRGIYWPPAPHGDKEFWARLKKVAPYFVPIMATEGAGISKQHPYEGATYPYPILITMPQVPDDLVYNMLKALVLQYPKYKDGAPGNDGWALGKQKFTWVAPYHPGAIRFYKERGLWTEEAQKHTDMLERRQAVLAEAWKKVKTRNIQDAAAFQKAWMEARAEALKGFEKVFR